MKKFELNIVYYPLSSYSDYKLECLIDGLDICKFYYFGEIADNRGFIFPLYNWFEENLDYILNENMLNIFTGINDDTEIINVLENAYNKEFINDDELPTEEEIEWFDKLNTWSSHHSWVSSGPLLFLPEVFFRKSKEKIVISWNNSKRNKKYDVEFISMKGFAYIEIDEFISEIKKFMKMFENIEKLKGEKLKRNFSLTEHIYVETNEDDTINISLENDILKKLKQIGYNLFSIHQLILLTEKDKKVLPILLEYISILADEKEKECLVRFLAVKNFIDAFPNLIKEFYNAKTLNYRLAIANTLSIIYNEKYLDSLLEIALNKNYKEARFPIILRLYQYNNKKVFETLKKLLEDEEVNNHAIYALSKFKDIF